ncbi:MAG: dihydrolipoyllysine-residue acetyltransferase, partial [Janthinobacterium lividum]
MSTLEVKVPDIGDFKEVEVIELLVKVGDKIAVDQSLITVESDKASMEIPSSAAGVVKELRIKIGDKVKEGSVLLVIDAEGAAADAPAASTAAPAAAAPAAAPAAQSAAPAAASAPSSAPAGSSEGHSATPVEIAAPAVAESGKSSVPAAPAAAAASPVATSAASPTMGGNDGVKPHASPSVRKFARELGVDLAKLSGSGPKGRITQEDVQGFVKALVEASNAPAKPAGKGGGAGMDLLPWPSLDFAKFGTTELQPLSRIKKLSGPNLHRNWVMIPHVTQFDEADVTELEEFRKSTNAAMAKSGVKLTMLAFVIKASVAALKKFPAFNSSLDASGENLILKQYYNIGFAADTPNGLMVPVIKGCDTKSLTQIAQEMADLSAQAREGKLKPADMQGATFTISSLGGIGGTSFTPIINAPEVAILGLSKSSMKPVWDGKQFVPRLMMGTSLSYDHRVIDGA